MVVRKGIALVLAAVALGVLPASAPAAFHLMKISEVSAGDPLGTGDFVELQMFSPGQNFLNEPRAGDLQQRRQSRSRPSS